MARTKYFAIAFGIDGFAGDSSFACDYAIPATKNHTLQELLIAWTRSQDEDGELFNCFGNDRPVGFWILTEKSLDIVRSTVVECHNDSAAYAQNANGKALVNKLSVEIVGNAVALTI